MKKERGPKGIMINLLAQGYKIIGSNILQSMLKSKLQIREHVNKQIVMRGNIVLFCLRSPQKGMMDINLRYVAAVTSKRGPHFPQPLAEHSYQSYLKYLEET